MKYYKCIIIAITLVTLAAPAAAGTGNGIIRSVTVTDTGVAIFRVDIHEKAPACSVNPDFAFNASTTEGKAKLALLLAAANGKKVVA